MNTAIARIPLTQAGRLAGAFNRWVGERVRRRRGPTRLPRQLEYRHIYVMPTRFGAWFGLLMVVMTVGGLNFNNNMTLLVCFLVGSLALMTTLLAYRNLVGLEVVRIAAEPVFAGETAQFQVVVRNPESRARFALEVVNEESHFSADVDPDQSARLALRQDALERGWLEAEPFSIQNRYPLGMFRAWTVVIPEARCLVYPQPAVAPPPLPRSGRGDEGSAHAVEGDHFHGLRDYQPGDPMRRIAWRASARHQKLYSRQMESPVEEACEMNWYLMPGKDTEEKLSILAAWILRAERHQIPYSLELPTAALPSGLGEDHRNACLEILALYPGR
jgi:uncharacterized protein (DUF58 family)